MEHRQTKLIVEEYMNSATIHGCHFIVKDTISKLENLGWALIVVLFFSCAADYLLNDEFESWAANPVIITVDSHQWTDPTLQRS